MNGRGCALTDVPVRRGVGVGEDRARAARKDGRQPMPLTLELTMTDGVDAAMKATKAICAKPFLDPCDAHARREDLSAADHPILPRGNVRQTPIRTGLVAFPFHIKG